MASRRTKSSPRKLSELARKVVVPDGVTGSGWPSVRDTCANRLGVQFDPWQHGAGRLILAKRSDGKLASMIGGVGMSLPRQVGKTYLIGSMAFGLCLNKPGLLVIWSAHHARTHGETFLAMQAFADRSRVKPYVRQVFTGSGDEEIRFRNGSRILFGARERGFGRGIPGVDMIVSDEGQIMSDKAQDAQLATMNTSAFGLAISVGTPPRPDDPSEAFTRMRSDAWNGLLQDAAWIEFGADRGSDPHDRKQWAKANPSYPHRTPPESILRLQRKLKPESFLREGLGVWDEDDGGGALSQTRWAALSEPQTERGAGVVFGVDVTQDREAWVAVAWQRPDEAYQVMLANDGNAMPAFRVGDYVKELSERWGGTVTGSKALEDEMAHGFVPLTSADFTIASGGFADLMEAGTVRHGNQPALNHAVKAAKWRSAGTGGERAFQLRDCPEVGPLAAAARALHVLGADVRPFVLS